MWTFHCPELASGHTSGFQFKRQVSSPKPGFDVTLPGPRQLTRRRRRRRWQLSPQSLCCANARCDENLRARPPTQCQGCRSFMVFITKGRFVCVTGHMGTRFLNLRMAGGGGCQQAAEGTGRSCKILGRQCAGGKVFRNALKNQQISF